MSEKRYKAGEALVLRLRKGDELIIEWANTQSELGDGVRYLIEEEIARNGIKDLAMEIVQKRPKLPNAKEIQRDLYLFIAEKGEVTPKESYDYLADKYDLKPFERSVITRTGNEPKWHNTVRWAKEKLKHEGLVQSKEGERGVWILTETGQKSYEYINGQEEL